MSRQSNHPNKYKQRSGNCIFALHGPDFFFFQEELLETRNPQQGNFIAAEERSKLAQILYGSTSLSPLKPSSFMYVSIYFEV
jgi:hypothetical protein